MNIIEASGGSYYHLLLALALTVGISVLTAITARILKQRQLARIAFAIFVTSLLLFAVIFFYVVLGVWKQVV